MTNPTIAAGYPKAFLDFAVSRGADRQTLIKRSQISLDDLKEQDNRIPLSNYIALMKAGIELCGEPALALLFGEAVKFQEISIVALIGEASETTDEARRQTNRYAHLTLDENDGRISDRLELVRENGLVWLKLTSALYAAHPLLTESAFALGICSARKMFGPDHIFTTRPYPKAIHFTHEEPT